MTLWFGIVHVCLELVKKNLETTSAPFRTQDTVHGAQGGAVVRGMLLREALGVQLVGAGPQQACVVAAPGPCRALLRDLLARTQARRSALVLRPRRDAGAQGLGL